MISLISRDGIGTVSWLELAFIVVTLTGIVRTTWGLHRWRRQDKRRIAEGLNGRLAIFYRGKVRLYLLCAVKMGIYFLLAAQAAFLPSYGADFNRLTPVQRRIATAGHYLSPGLLSISALLLILIPFYEERDKHRMDEADRHEWRGDVQRAMDED